MVHFGKWGCGASCICRDLVLIKFVDFVSFVAHYLVPSEVWQRLDKVFHLFKCIYWASSMLSLTHFSNENFFSRRKIWTSRFQWKKPFFFDNNSDTISRYEKLIIFKLKKENCSIFLCVGKNDVILRAFDFWLIKYYEKKSDDFFPLLCTYCLIFFILYEPSPADWKQVIDERR